MMLWEIPRAMSVRRIDSGLSLLGFPSGWVLNHRGLGAFGSCTVFQDLLLCFEPLRDLGLQGTFAIFFFFLQHLSELLSQLATDDMVLTK